MTSQSRYPLAALAILSSTTLSLAQGFGGFGGNSGNPYSNGGDGDGNGDGDNNPYSDGNGGFNFGRFNFSHAHVVITAHAVLATLAFALFFPIGGILIRLGNFRGLWLVHALIQLGAYVLYIAAFGLGIWMINQRTILLSNAHPIIGIVLFILLFFQPFLGVLHHFLFKKHSKRIFWSYGHIWLGRIIITLGIINGGLGLQLAKEMPIAPPSEGQVIAYSVVAGTIWVVYVLATIVGERRRARVPAYDGTKTKEVPRKEEYA